MNRRPKSWAVATSKLPLLRAVLEPLLALLLLVPLLLLLALLPLPPQLRSGLAAGEALAMPLQADAGSAAGAEAEVDSMGVGVGAAAEASSEGRHLNRESPGTNSITRQQLCGRKGSKRFIDVLHHARASWAASGNQANSVLLDTRHASAAGLSGWLPSPGQPKLQ